jgi:hypothetical protein
MIWCRVIFVDSNTVLALYHSLRYHVTIGGGLLALHYRDSLPTALKALYPSHEWLPWRFKHAPKGFWANQENRIAFFDWCGSQLGINHANLDAWYSIKRNQVEQLGGDGLLVNYYGHSLTTALADIYPDHRWDPARFLNSSSPSSAIDISAVLSEFAEQRQVKCLEDWYRVSSRQWKGHKLAPIIKRHGGLPAVLKLVYPDHKWQLSSFSVLGKKAMQFKLKSAVAQIFPAARIDEDVHTTQIASWKTIRHLEFDIFLPEYNLALEYQGEQHFQATVPTMRTQQHWEQADAEKMALCQRYGICLIDVPFHDWDGSPASMRARILAARPDLQCHMSSSS